jgi:hypothetical protein
MKLVLRCRELSSGVYEADVPPVDVSRLGKSRRVGEASVLLLAGNPEFAAGDLTFAPASITVLNTGTTSRTVIILNGADSESKRNAMTATSSGDAEFLGNLPSSLRDIGGDLLAGVRKRWDGSLALSASGKFVETPDNFWTVKIQPRDVSLRLTVRGEPSRVGGVTELGVKPDMNGYSTFKIRSCDEVPIALAVLFRARRRQ